MIPRMLHRRGALAALFTDFWNPIPPPLKPLAKKIGGNAVRRALNRWTPEIAPQIVHSNMLPALYWALRLKSARGRRQVFEIHRRCGQQFARSVANSLDRLDFTSFVGFSSAALEALQKAREKRAVAILDEIAPTHLEEEILAEERKAFPGWEPHGEAIGQAYLDRLR